MDASHIVVGALTAVTVGLLPLLGLALVVSSSHFVAHDNEQLVRMVGGNRT